MYQLEYEEGTTPVDIKLYYTDTALHAEIL
jgi:hypothetical protein